MLLRSVIPSAAALARVAVAGIATATCAPADGHAMAAGKDDEQRAVAVGESRGGGSCLAAGSPDAVHVLEPDDLATLRTG